jgi:hypothetical protein
MIAASEIINQADVQLRNLLNVRAMFPTIRENMVGKRCFSTAPLYQSLGYNINFQFDPPLTEKGREEINQIGRWVNQSYVVWLCALLEFYWIIPPQRCDCIDQNLEGHEDVDILRRLRNKLVHRSGTYDPTDSEAKTLYERMVNRFSLRTESSETARQYPVHINDFLIPLTEGCKHYVRARVAQPSYQDRMVSRRSGSDGPLSKQEGG